MKAFNKFTIHYSCQAPNLSSRSEIQNLIALQVQHMGNLILKGHMQRCHIRLKADNRFYDYSGSQLSSNFCNIMTRIFREMPIDDIRISCCYRQDRGCRLTQMAQQFIGSQEHLLTDRESYQSCEFTENMQKAYLIVA